MHQEPHHQHHTRQRAGQQWCTRQPKRPKGRQLQSWINFSTWKTSPVVRTKINSLRPQCCAATIAFRTRFYKRDAGCRAAIRIALPESSDTRRVPRTEFETVSDEPKESSIFSNGQRAPWIKRPCNGEN